MQVKKLGQELSEYFNNVKISKIEKKDINQKYKLSDVYSLSTEITYNDGDHITLLLICASEFFGLIKICDEGDLNFRTNNFIEESRLLRHVKFISIEEGEIKSDLMNKFAYLNSNSNDSLSQIAFLIYNIIHLMKDIELDYHTMKR